MGLSLQLTDVIMAVGGLGTAAMGVVDATKVFWGGVNHIGFSTIRKRITALTPGTPAAAGTATNALSQNEILGTLKANWFNGTDLSSQKAIAKSLIKLFLNPANAKSMANATGVDSNTLEQIAAKLESGQTLASNESDCYSRFDFILTALLDETYQRSDQIYRNSTRAWAVVASLVLSLAGAVAMDPPNTGHNLGKAIVCGLLATPLAPVAKDLSTALATAVNTLQAVKK
jgi:hypothetical protein